MDTVTNGSTDSTDDPGRAQALDGLDAGARAIFERVRVRLGMGEDVDDHQRTIDRFLLRGKLGRGGMGVVYKAYDPKLERQVAIKLVRAQPFADHEQLQARLQREAQTLAKLTHPNVVSIYDVGEHLDELFLAMEYIEGQTLREWQEQESHEPKDLLDAYRRAAMGLAAAHDAGIVHRDFKPDNVLVANDGRVLVSDFGLAGAPSFAAETAHDNASVEASTADRRLTQTGVLVGTPPYMAPEQLRGSSATAKSDQFAFCVSLWEALVGRRPFEGDDREALLAEIECGGRRGEDELHRRERSILVRGLAADPEDRHRNMHALVDALEERRLHPGWWLALAAVALISFSAVLVFAGKNAADSQGAEEPLAQTCTLQDTLSQVRLSDTPLRQRLANVHAEGAYAPIDARLAELERDAEAVCQAAVDHQYVARWVRDLASLLENAERIPLDVLLDELEELARDGQLHKPTIDHEVLDALERSKEAEREGDLDEALRWAEVALEKAKERDVERAEAYLRRGRVLALDARPREALDDYEEASRCADRARYDEARLRAYLLSAKTAVMRVEDLERARRELRAADGVLTRLREPEFSSTRATYRELMASALKRQGQIDAALDHQLWVLARHEERGTQYEQGMAHINLGTIYEWDPNDQVRLAEARDHYERALELLDGPVTSPGVIQAKFDLGHWLISYGRTDRDFAEGRRLLDEVIDVADMRVPALKTLLIDALSRDRAADATRLADELQRELEVAPPTSKSELFESGSILALALAANAELEQLEQLVAQLEQLRGDVTDSELAELELNVAEFMPAARHAQARDWAARARDRLNQIPEDERPRALVDDVEAFLAERPG